MNNQVAQSFLDFWQKVDLETSEDHMSVLSFLEGADVEVLLSDAYVREELCFAFIGDVPVEPRYKAEGEIRKLLREKWPKDRRWW